MIRFCFFAILSFATAAFADAVNISLTSGAVMGQSQPAVNVHILEPIAGFKLNLKRSDGKDIEIKGGGKVGQTRVLDLNQPEGKFGYTGALTVNFKNGSFSEMPLQFDAELWGPLHMKCEKEDIDFENRKLKFTASRPIAKAVVKVLMDTGKYAMNGEVLFSGEAANKPLEISWPEKPGKVMKVSIQIFDSAQFFTGVEFSPWQIDIVHKDVNFASGKWDVSPEEGDKLEESYAKIADVVNKIGQHAEVKLYVIGHTDTVGKNDANRTLSLNRARSIAGYLRKRGLRIPIFYEGYGEDALLVGTNDEVAEAQNRRADYVMSIDPPTLGKVPHPPKWQRL
jgi:outer membrane protein OmpA-like peptidoglycan-associated protein